MTDVEVDPGPFIAPNPGVPALTLEEQTLGLLNFRYEIYTDPASPDTPSHSGVITADTNGIIRVMTPKGSTFAKFPEGNGELIQIWLCPKPTVNAPFKPAPVPPVISSLTPNSIPVNVQTTVVINGSGFNSTTYIYVNGAYTPSDLTGVNDETTRTFKFISGSGGTFKVKVMRTPDNLFSNEVDLIVAVPPPSITSLTPNSVANTAGTTNIIIAGANFKNTDTCYVDDVLTPHVYNISSQITLNYTPLGVPTGVKKVKVKNADGVYSNEVDLTVTA